MSLKKVIRSFYLNNFFNYQNTRICNWDLSPGLAQPFFESSALWISMSSFDHKIYNLLQSLPRLNDKFYYSAVLLTAKSGLRELELRCYLQILKHVIDELQHSAPSMTAIGELPHRFYNTVGLARATKYTASRCFTRFACSRCFFTKCARIHNLSLYF